MRETVAKTGLIHRVIHSPLYNALARQGLSIRGYILLFFLTYLILGPVRAQHDIVSAVAALGFGTILGILGLLTLVHGRILRKSLLVSAHFPSSSEIEGVRSKAEIPVIVRTSKIRVLPLYVLELKIKWKHEDLPTPEIRLSGSSKIERIISFSLVAPHRGIWSIESIECELKDRLGLSHKSWVIEEKLAAPLEVAPPLNPFSSLPIMSSSHRSGDSAPDMENRAGDLFDIKQYHPADGAKKILWKVFARRGELLSRHPEPSFTPEGQVILFGLCRTFDDHVASQLVAYASRLEEMNLEIFVGCDGLGTSADVARSSKKAEELLIKTAWNVKEFSLENSTRSIQETLSAAQVSGPGIIISKVIIFIAEEIFISQETCHQIQELGVHLLAQKIEPVYCICSSEEHAFALNGASKLPLMSQVKKLFLAESNVNGKMPVAANFYKQFVANCANQNWQILVVRS